MNKDFDENIDELCVETNTDEMRRNMATIGQLNYWFFLEKYMCVWCVM